MRPAAKSRSRAPHEDVILFAVNGTRFAIAANAVDEIRNMEGLSPFKATVSPAKFAKVKHTLVRDKKDRDAIYFVVDANAHFRVAQSKSNRLLVLRNTRVAVLVDSIDRMTQIANVYSLPLAFTGEERNWYRGLAIVEDAVVPVVYAECFLSKGEVAVLQASTAQGTAAAMAARKGAATA